MTSPRNPLVRPAGVSPVNARGALHQPLSGLTAEAIRAALTEGNTVTGRITGRDWPS